MDLFSELGELAIGSRLKRLSDYIMQEGLETYKNYRIDFDPKWFPVYYLLSQQEGLGITEIASNLGISHPGVIKLAKELEQKGYAESVQDQSDRRRRILSLSKKGKALLPQMQEAWKDIAGGIALMLQEQEHNLLQAIVETEQSFQVQSFPERIRHFRDTRLLDAIEIIDYQAEYGSYFKAFNYAWIQRYFTVEPIDIEILEQHQKKILAPGGCIIFARLEGNIVGTCALKNDGDGVYELTKMAVTEAAQGKQVGKKLGLAIIEKGRQMGAHTIFLESNRQLTPALALYRRLGFVEVAASSEGQSEYLRADIKMELKF